MDPTPLLTNSSPSNSSASLLQHVPYSAPLRIKKLIIPGSVLEFQRPFCCQHHTHLSGLCSNQDHDDIWAFAASQGHIWVHGPTATGFCVNVHGPCYQWRPGKTCALKSSSPADLIPPFTGLGRCDPAPHWLL